MTLCWTVTDPTTSQWMTFCQVFLKDHIKTRQIVIPAHLWTIVLHTAHDSSFAGHYSVKKTLQRVLTSSFWPGTSMEVIRYCPFCDLCQKAVAKGHSLCAIAHDAYSFVAVSQNCSGHHGSTSAFIFGLSVHSNRSGHCDKILWSDKVLWSSTFTENWYCFSVWSPTFDFQSHGFASWNLVWLWYPIMPDCFNKIWKPYLGRSWSGSLILADS